MANGIRRASNINDEGGCGFEHREKELSKGRRLMDLAAMRITYVALYVCDPNNGGYNVGRP